MDFRADLKINIQSFNWICLKCLGLGQLKYFETYFVKCSWLKADVILFNLNLILREGCLQIYFNLCH